MVDREAIQDEAAHWLVRHDAGDMSAQEQAAFASWAAITRHRAAFIRLQVAWQRCDVLRRLRPLDGDVDPDLLAPGREERPVPIVIRAVEWLGASVRSSLWWRRADRTALARTVRRPTPPPNA
jgi:ferric-dicitrate binding protein FerR (iron transport regulator)